MVFTMVSLPDPSSPLPPAVLAELQQIAPGQVHVDAHHRLLYATDASIYQVEPLGVVTPPTTDALAAIVALCGRHAIAVLPRGGGTSLPGQCTNRALVVDHARHCRAVLNIDVPAQLCHVEPGITIDELNRHLDAQRTSLFFAPDPATAAQASIGGCLGNNAAGARSIRYGRTSENVAGIEIALSNGGRTWLEPGAGRHSPLALELAQRVAAVVQRYATQIRQRFPKTRRRNAGLALDSVLTQLDGGIGVDDLDLTGLLCGSEGILAATLTARLKLHPIPRGKGLAILSFGTLEAAIEAVAPILQTEPSAIELIDDVVLTAARGNNECRAYMDLLADVGGTPPAAVLYVEYQSPAGLEPIRERMAALKLVLPDAPTRIYYDQPALLRAWALRKAGEPLLHGLASHRKPVTCVEDNAVPVENLVRFVAEFKKIVTRHGTTAAYYAHASVGVLHVRPMLDLHDPADLDRLRSIATEVADLARACGGVMSGEHGDGRLRGPLLERFYGPELMDAFRQIKAIFDPAGILNPGNIVDAGPISSITENLRLQPDAKPLLWPNVETYYDYSDQEGFSGAVEMCSGAGVCRKTGGGGAMCPSYRATLDERHSTRGRANALRLAITGQLPAPPAGRPGKAAWNDPETAATLALCLSCKACKTECPSNVDVARLKAEYTAQGYKAAGRVPLQARIIGNIRKLNALGARMPGLANALAALPPLRGIANKLLGLAPERSVPKFSESLYRWFARHRGGRGAAQVSATAPRIVLFGDCFVTYSEPEIGRAAVRILETLGYRVEFPRVGCCGRSMISVGMLAEAIRSADAVLTQLRPFIEADDVRAIVVCEPSCLSAMKDDWLSLKLKTPLALRQKLAAKAMLPEEFVERYWDAHPNPIRLPAPPETAGPANVAPSSSLAPSPSLAASPSRRVAASSPLAPSSPLAASSPVLYHGHCHQKALWGQGTSQRVLRRLVGARLTVLPSGCCGMAGAFGYTRERYELSMKIGEQSLLSTLRQSAPETTILAAGTSCRHQIHDGAARRAIHPIVLLADLIAPG
jgi:FAD/FMN-containing dehydrogenase/Fe-S oxidoreductase